MKILVVSPSWVGDMIMSQALLRRLKADYPLGQIDVLAPDWCRGVLERMPEVSQSIAMPVGHGQLNWGLRKSVAQELSTSDYDLAILLPNSLKSALIPWMAKIPQRRGWRGEMRYGLLNDLRTLDKQAFPLMVQRYAALAEKNLASASALKPILNPLLTVNVQQQQAVVERLNLPNRSVVSFCPGAEFGPAKRWPHYHFSRLASLLIDAGHSVLCLGSAKDQDVISQIQGELSSQEQQQFFSAAGQTSLAEAIDLLAYSDAIVTNDSGLMHMGAAVGTPMIALYGPTSPEFTPPLSDNADIIRLIDGFIKIRRGDADQGYHQSMIDILPEDVFEKLIKKLK